jgi:hypothetical protein
MDNDDGDLTYGTKNDLSSDSLGEVLPGVWNFLGHMGDCIWGTDGKSSVQNTCQESKSASPTSLIVPG